MGPAMTKHVMKANGVIEDGFTVCSLTPKECVNAACFENRRSFWRPLRTNGVSRRQSRNWAMTSSTLFLTRRTISPAFPKLDDELTDAKASRDFLVNSEVLLPAGNAQELA